MSTVHSSDTSLIASDTAKRTHDRETICDTWQKASLLDPAHQFLGRSGKQIRKYVVDLVYSMSGGLGSAPACLGDAIEWLHAGSLVIDDIQDSSTMRRELPALHVEIGIPLALNAGNWMYFQALDKLFDKSLDRRVQLKLLHLLIATALRCHQGQSLDLAARVDRIDPATIGTLVSEISRLKTGSLVAMAASFGGVAAGANRILRNALTKFGMNIGIALQMRNDLEELRSMISDSSMGLAIRVDDLRNARVTWPWAWAFQRCTCDEFAGLVHQLSAAKDDPEAMVELARQLLKRAGSVGDRVIQDRVERHFRLVGEHVLDLSSMNLLRVALQRISHPEKMESSEAAVVDLA